MIRKPLILIVDDEPSILQMLKEALEDENFAIETLSDGSKVIDAIGRLVPDLVLLDIFIPKYNGLELLTHIKKEYPSQQVMMISGFGTIQIALDAVKRGASDFIEKPLNLDDILTKLSFLKNPGEQYQIDAAHHTTFEQHGIVGASTLFLELMHHVNLIAPLDTPTLIFGPHGSGKTLIANYIHKTGKLKDLPCIDFDCSVNNDLSILSMPHTGTFFIKNIHLLSDQGQRVVLSRLMEDNESIRFIATSTINLFQAVQNNTFNKSLYCKFNQTPIEIPSINKRRYDIPLLADHFLKNSSSDSSIGLRFSVPAMRILRNHTWIGDVAGIKKFIEMMHKTIPSHLREIDENLVTLMLPEHSRPYLEEQMFSRFNSLEQATTVFQQRYLSHLLKTHRYDTQQLADFLQIPVSQLHDTISKLHIDIR